MCPQRTIFQVSPRPFVGGSPDFCATQGNGQQGPVPSRAGGRKTSMGELQGELDLAPNSLGSWGM